MTFDTDVDEPTDGMLCVIYRDDFISTFFFFLEEKGKDDEVQQIGVYN